MHMSELRNAQFRDKVAAAYSGSMDVLNRGDAAAQTLAPGAALPEVLRPNAEWQLVSSAELLDSGPLVVTFFRGDWRRFCILLLAALKKALPDVRDIGAALVAMTPGTGGRALRARRRQCLKYKMLAGVDNEAAMQFGVVVNPPASYLALLAENGINLAERHGNRAGFMPLPATFVVGSGGVARNAWIGPYVTRRVEPSGIVDAVRRLSLASGHPLPAGGRP